MVRSIAYVIAVICATPAEADSHVNLIATCRYTYDGLFVSGEFGNPAGLNVPGQVYQIQAEDVQDGGLQLLARGYGEHNARCPSTIDPCPTCAAANRVDGYVAPTIHGFSEGE